MNKRALILNSVIFILVFISTVMMFTGFKFMESPDIVYVASRIEIFKFYTVDSNLFMGIVSLIFVIYIAFSHKKSIPRFLYILKLSATAGVFLTFLTTTIYLAPKAKYGYFSLFTNSNLFFHFIVPVISVVTFLFFEKNNKLKIRDCLLALIPTLIYALVYLFNIIIHLENGKIVPECDFYGFARGGFVSIFIVFSFMMLISFLICLFLWKVNGRRNYEE